MTLARFRDEYMRQSPKQWKGREDQPDIATTIDEWKRGGTMADNYEEEAALVARTVGAYLSDPAYISRMSSLSAADQQAFLADPKAFLAEAGFPVPEGMIVNAAPAPENFHLGKFKICVDFPVHACYCHGPGETC